MTSFWVKLLLVLPESKAKKRQGIQPLRLNIQELSLGTVDFRAENLFAVFGAPQKRVVRPWDRLNAYFITVFRFRLSLPIHRCDK